MSIGFHRETGVFTLDTLNSTYQMKADPEGVLLHLYYGPRTDGDMSYLIRPADRGFSGNPYAKRAERSYSLDTLPQEYSGTGTGDYRLPSVQVANADGSASAEFRFAGYRIGKGREPLPGLPYVRPAADTETLEVVLKDAVTGLTARLFYRVFPAFDVIVRSVRLENAGGSALTLEKAASVCVDFPYGAYDLIHFPGRHCMERVPERLALPKGIAAFGSRRGMSSHHHNPFVILAERHADEDKGNCFGLMLVYSGNHLEEAETDQTGSVRLVAGIHPDGFRWRLAPGDAFDTPEAILCFSAEGLNGLSRRLHALISRQIIPERYMKGPRPILINSWEAAYFRFDAQKILSFAQAAKDLGIDMLVLDDGWFGRRDDDTSGLGDWTVNEKKLGCSMKELSDRIHGLGLRFGLWFEPEMVSEDSDLYRAHPDWALTDPGRSPVMSRSQLVLDMSRPEVVDHLFGAICAVLDEARIEYIKWDFNRSVANCFSRALPADRQGETAHRFMLGTYRLLARLLARYPELMIEGCSGGGGRFDAGMLFYCPQIWCSDDTDAIERVEIQRGTSYGYPVSAMGAHVSASPNHQTGRAVPLHTRGVVAQSGAFGFELNPLALSDDEKAGIRAQIAAYRRYGALIARGTYYRLTTPEDQPDYTAWMFVSPDRSEALVSLVATHIRANGPFPYVRLKGLDPGRTYRAEEEGGEARALSGAALMCAGYAFPQPWGDHTAFQLHLKEL